jgi:hypothetical protein
MRTQLAERDRQLQQMQMMLMHQMQQAPKVTAQQKAAPEFDPDSREFWEYREQKLKSEFTQELAGLKQQMLDTYEQTLIAQDEDYLRVTEAHMQQVLKKYPRLNPVLGADKESLDLVYSLCKAEDLKASKGKPRNAEGQAKAKAIVENLNKPPSYHQMTGGKPMKNTISDFATMSDDDFERFTQGVGQGW